MPCLPSRNQTLTIAVKKHAKLDKKFLKSCPIVQFYWISLLCAKYFGQDCFLEVVEAVLVQRNLVDNQYQQIFTLYILYIIYISTNIYNINIYFYI